MSTDQKLDLILGELKGLNNKFDGLESRFDGLESRFDGLESRFDKFEDNLNDFKFNTEQEFIATRQLINQSFERISDNFAYQDKVDKIEKILQSKAKAFI